MDLGGVDGRHITDMAWRCIKHPSEIVNVGDEIRVRVLNLTEIVSVSWASSSSGRSLGGDQSPLPGKPHCTEGHEPGYGYFVEIEYKVEFARFQMDWTNKNIHLSKVVQVGDDVKA